MDLAPSAMPLPPPRTNVSTREPADADSEYQMIRVHPDFASRIEQQLDELRARFAHGPAVLDAFRAANASLHPQEVATWLVQEAGIWIPARCWAGIARHRDGQPTPAPGPGLTPEAGP